MAHRPKFRLLYPPLLKRHLRTVEKRHHALIRQQIREQLESEPDLETRNRKPLKRPAVFGAQWEIRIGPGNRFRVFYQVNRDGMQVEIVAIGEKVGERLLIGGEEVKS
jgi:mRNA-degrading endonuclease RelE of RelBE toxin-antitoxin system